MVSKRKLGTAAGIVVGAVALSAAPAFAHQCINASKKDHSAGAQVVIGADESIISAKKGVLNRVERGIIDPETGAGLHGIVAFDIDGDGTADGHTYLVGPEFQIQEEAQSNGPACKGITNIDVYFSECVGS